MLWIHIRVIQGSRDQLAFDQSPGLIAVFHALHRLLAPRHPPHALSSLAALIFPLAVGEPWGLSPRFRRHKAGGSLCLTRTRTSSATTCPCIRTGLCNEFILRFSRRIQRILL